LDKASAASANMYKKFAGTQGSATQTPPPESQWNTQTQYAQETNYQAQPSAYSGSYRRTPKRKFDYYIAPKYVLMPDILMGSAVEGGLIWGKGAFFGIDWGAGINDAENGGGFWLGGGLSLGNTYNLGHQLQLVYGGTAGFWWVGADKRLDIPPSVETREVYQSINYLSFAGPFVRLRWNFVELTYRGLLGMKYTGGSHYKGDSGMYGDLWKLDEKYGEKDKIVNWNNHQLMLGVYFATSKREK